MTAAALTMGSAYTILPYGEDYEPLERALLTLLGERGMTAAREHFACVAVVATAAGEDLTLYQHLATGEFIALDALGRTYMRSASSLRFTRAPWPDAFRDVLRGVQAA